MKTGYVKYYRKITDWQWYMDIPCRLIFMHLLAMANFTEQKYKNITIKPGEYLTTLENLAKENGLSVQQTRTALRKLKSTNDITIKSTNKFTIISLVNWGTYQGRNFETNKQNNKQLNNQLTNKQQTPYINIRMQESKNISTHRDIKPNNQWGGVPIYMEQPTPPSTPKIDTSKFPDDIRRIVEQDAKNEQALDYLIKLFRESYRGIVGSEYLLGRWDKKDLRQLCENNNWDTFAIANKIRLYFRLGMELRDSADGWDYSLKDFISRAPGLATMCKLKPFSEYLNSVNGNEWLRRLYQFKLEKMRERGLTEDDPEPPDLWGYVVNPETEEIIYLEPFTLETMEIKRRWRQLKAGKHHGRN